MVKKRFSRKREFLFQMLLKFSKELSSPLISSKDTERDALHLITLTEGHEEYTFDISTDCNNKKTMELLMAKIKKEFHDEKKCYDYINEKMGERSKYSKKRKYRNERDLYTAANVSKEVFSKIRNKKTVPNKNTTLALAYALELNQEEMHVLLEYAGIFLRRSSLADCVYEFIFKEKFYEKVNIFELNVFLHNLEIPLLGSYIRERSS